jgi:hypothetical protein
MNIIKYLVENLDKFNISAMAEAVGMSRSKVQRRLVQGNWTDEEVANIENYFKTISNDIAKIYNEG